ncbi:MAG TPA: BTAD domain-containing putative transcriptional regulator, partial [Acidimicrobiales bacterium]
MGSGPAVTWTVLFTDLVASTELRTRVGEDAFDAIRLQVDTTVGAIVAAYGGDVLKSTGDGVMAAFTGTAAALRCAVAVQRAVAERNATASEPVALRIGIAVGDAVVEPNDLHGTAVVEAARLCSVADGGMILCSDAVRTASANRSGCQFSASRALVLKGLPEPVTVHEVPWAPEGPTEVDRPSFGVLGALDVTNARGDQLTIGGLKERQLLALLLVHANNTVSTDRLVDALWGERPPRTAERTLHAYVARLRRAIEPERPHGRDPQVLETVGRAYRLNVEPSRLDCARFEALASEGARELEAGSAARADEVFSMALAQWRGDAYCEFTAIDACATEASRLLELRLLATEHHIDARLATGRAGELSAELERLVHDHPFRERLWAQLMLALYRSGRQRDALDAFQRARTVLVEEMGLEPGPELRHLEAAVLAQDPSLDAAVLRPPAVGATTFPLALEAVGPAFVGRDAESAWLLAAWEAAVAGSGSFLSVVGREGAGKTRLAAELAHHVHQTGGLVLYSRCDHAHRGAAALVDLALRGAGGSIADLAVADGNIAAALARYLPTWSGGRPVLFVLDDLHIADTDVLEFVADIASWCRSSCLLVVGAFRSDGAVDAVDRPSTDGTQLVLGPLDSEAVGQICELYDADGWSSDDVRQVAEATGSLPLLVHERASELARQRASRRVEDAAGRLAATRGRLLTSRGEVTEGVEGIQRLLEQRRLQLAGREAQMKAERIAALSACPYKGLARFEPVDAANFFGRERLVAELVARLAEVPLLAVVGPSGSGKSSLVRAGLLPALTDGVLTGERWRTVMMCPGPFPATELTSRLASMPAGPGPLVVFVDQFEEIFTFDVDEADRSAFIERLLALARQPSTAVVLAIRADHLASCAAHPSLANALVGNDVLVGPMQPGELRRTIELPAQRAGLEVEPGLIDVIIGDVAGRAGALPLLSTALAETWERRRERTLALAGYHAAGGVNGALARLAEDAFASIPEQSRPAARRILLRLCEADDLGGFQLTRRLAVNDLVDEQDTDGRAALEIMADRRLLSLDGGLVEVAHEALLREWPR